MRRSLIVIVVHVGCPTSAALFYFPHKLLWPAWKILSPLPFPTDTSVNLGSAFRGKRGALITFEIYYKFKKVDFFSRKNIISEGRIIKLTSSAAGSRECTSEF